MSAAARRGAVQLAMPEAGVGYCQDMERQVTSPTLFDLAAVQVKAGKNGRCQEMSR